MAASKAPASPMARRRSGCQEMPGVRATLALATSCEGGRGRKSSGRTAPTARHPTCRHACPPGTPSARHRCRGRGPPASWGPPSPRRGPAAGTAGGRGDLGPARHRATSAGPLAEHPVDFAVERRRQAEGERLEGLRDRQGGRIAIVGRFLHHPAHHVGQAFGESRHQLLQRLGVARLVREELLHQARRGEGDLAGDHVIEGASQRVDVAPRVDRMRVPRLLRRDVVERADGGPVAGHLGLVGQVDRQPEVGQLGRPVAGHEDVARVDVAVDQPLLLRVLQPQGDLPRQPRGDGRGHRCRSRRSAGRRSSPRCTPSPGSTCRCDIPSS